MATSKISNFQDGHLKYNNTGAAISSGDVLDLTGCIAVALNDIAATTGVGTVALSGVFELAANNLEAFTTGEALWWNAGAGELTTTASTHSYAGVAAEDKLAAGTVGKVILNFGPNQT